MKKKSENEFKAQIFIVWFTISRLKSAGSLLNISAARSSTTWAGFFPDADDDWRGRVDKMLVNNLKVKYLPEKSLNLIILFLNLLN